VESTPHTGMKVPAEKTARSNCCGVAKMGEKMSIMERGW